MDPDKVLINKSTKRNLDIFFKSNFSCLALIGPVGSGKTFLAENIASLMLKEGIKDSPIVKIDAKIEGIEQIRDLQKDLKLKTFSHGEIKRVVIISHFDHFGFEAQNALLKTLEEPPIDTLIIITIAKEKKVLETIFSRVKKVKVNPISYDEIPENLTSKYSETEINKAYRLSIGQAGLFVNLVNNQKEHSLVNAIEFCKQLLAYPKYKQIAEIDKIIKNKDETFPETICEALLRIFKASHDNLVQNSEDVSPSIKRSHERLVLISNCQNDISLGLNKKLAFTRLFIRI